MPMIIMLVPQRQLGKYEPILNTAFETFAEQYGTVIPPTRIYRPNDNVLLNVAVKFVYQRIYIVVADEILQVWLR